MTEKKRKKKIKKRPKKSGKSAISDRESWLTTEEALTRELDADLKDAWQKFRDVALRLGEQRIYASGRAIVFSKKVCHFFVRPHKSYLEVVFFLSRAEKNPVLKRPQKVSSSKYSHAFRLVHADEVDEPLTGWLREAYDRTAGND